VQIDFDTLGEKLLILTQLPAPPAATTRRWRIPVVYGGEHGIDLEDVAKALNTTPDDIVARHVAGNYRVAMMDLHRAGPISVASRTRCGCRGGQIRAC